MGAYVPTNSVFGLQNYVMQGRVITGVPEQPRYPASNLLLNQRSERWRAPSNVAFIAGFDLARNVTPNAFATVDCRLYDPAQGGWIEKQPTAIYGANDSAFATGLVGASFPAHTAFLSGGPSTLGSPDQVNSQGGVFLYYADTDDSGVALPARRFWGFYMPVVGGADAYWEIGLLWLGRRWEVPVDIKFRTQSESNSKVGRLDSGAKYFDRRRRGRQVQLTTTTAQTEDRLAFRSALEQAEGLGVLADLWAFRINKGTGISYPERVDGMLYGFLDGRTTWEMRTVKAGRYGFSIEEAVA